MKKEKPRTLSIEEQGRLNAMKKAMRETTHRIKPIIYKDKKRENNKFNCRKNNIDFDSFGRG